MIATLLKTDNAIALLIKPTGPVLSVVPTGKLFYLHIVVWPYIEPAFK